MVETFAPFWGGCQLLPAQVFGSQVVGDKICLKIGRSCLEKGLCLEKAPVP